MTRGCGNLRDDNEYDIYCHRTKAFPTYARSKVGTPCLSTCTQGQLLEEKQATVPCATIVLNVYKIVPKPQVSAVGKYCYVVPSEDELDFGDQPVVAGGGGPGNDHGSRPRKDFTLRNQSVVPAAFNVSGAEPNNKRILHTPIGPAWTESASKIR